jgi:hypothetical protein
MNESMEEWAKRISSLSPSQQDELLAKLSKPTKVTMSKRALRKMFSDARADLDDLTIPTCDGGQETREKMIDKNKDEK